MKDPVFPVFAGLATFLPLLPLAWHWRIGNWSMIFLMLWLAIANAIMFINTLIWYNTVDIIVPVWCDITTRIYLMSGIAVPAAILCIARRLESIASTRQVSQSPSDNRRRAIFECGLCVGLPVVFGVLSTVYSGHRFDIYEGMGCFSAIYISWPWVAFNLAPVLLTSLLSLLYSLLAFRWFVVRRRQFIAVLANSGAKVDKSRYLRMMIFCSVDILFTLPISIWNTTTLIRSFGGQLLSYTSWADVHDGYGTILQIPAYFFDEGQELSGTFSRFDLNRWISPISAIIFVCVFGTSKDALESYRAAGRWTLRIFKGPFAKKTFSDGSGHRSRQRPLVVAVTSTVHRQADAEKGIELDTPSTVGHAFWSEDRHSSAA